MQADPDHTEIKDSLRRIRSRHAKAFDLNPEFFEAILDVPDAELFVDDCPHCGEPVMAEKRFSGEMQCPHCSRSVYSDGEDYYTSRRASKRQSSTNGTSTSTQSRRSETRSRTRETRSEDGQKKFVCRDCSTVKHKDEDITGTKCPECGEKMVTKYGNSSSQYSTRNRSNKTSRRSKREPQNNKFESKDNLDENRMVCKECGIIVRGARKERCPKCGGGLSNERLEMEEAYKKGEGRESQSSAGSKEFICPSCSRSKVTGNSVQSAQCSNCGSKMRPASETSSSSTKTSRTSETNEDCFVATAVYGDVDHPDVRRLRRFRDETLRHAAWGRTFIAWYERHGPGLAERVEGHRTLRRGIRWVLSQFVERGLR